MTTTALTVFTVVLGGIVIAFTVCMFIVFSRFLDKEKEAAERFRAEHRGKNRKE